MKLLTLIFFEQFTNGLQGFVPTNGLHQPQVITSQVKGLLGITGIKGRGFVNVWVRIFNYLLCCCIFCQVGVFSNLTSIQWYDTAVSAFCMIVLYFLRVGFNVLAWLLSRC